jgi:hypothetical protein
LVTTICTVQSRAVYAACCGITVVNVISVTEALVVLVGLSVVVAGTEDTLTILTGVAAVTTDACSVCAPCRGQVTLIQRRADAVFLPCCVSSVALAVPAVCICVATVSARRRAGATTVVCRGVTTAETATHTRVVGVVLSDSVRTLTVGSVVVRKATVAPICATLEDAVVPAIAIAVVTELCIVSFDSLPWDITVVGATIGIGWCALTRLSAWTSCVCVASVVAHTISTEVAIGTTTVILSTFCALGAFTVVGALSADSFGIATITTVGVAQTSVVRRCQATSVNTIV